MKRTIDTSDVYAAAWLIANGVRAIRVIPGRLVAWVFDDTNGTASELLALWKSGEPCPIDAHDYVHGYAIARRDTVTFRATA